MEKMLTIKKLREILDAIPIEKDELLVCYVDSECLCPYKAIDANIEQVWINNIEQEILYIT